MKTYVHPITSTEEWRIDPGEDGCIYFTDGEDQGPVCVVGCPESELSKADEKRMAIILQAPQLLELLTRAVTHFDPACEHKSAGSVESWIRLARAVIEKANPQPKGCGL
jgi:hypothetical protein